MPPVKVAKETKLEGGGSLVPAPAPAPASVVVAVDGSRLSFKAIEVARRLIGDNGKLILVHAADEASSVKETKRLVIEMVAKCESFALDSRLYDVIILDQTEGSFGLGLPLDKRIMAFLNEKKPLCFVMGIFGKSGPSSFSKGSKTDHALRSCPCTVIIVKPDSRLPTLHEPARFLVSVRGTLNTDLKLLERATFLLTNPKDKIILYHCRATDLDAETEKKIDNACQALREILTKKGIAHDFEQEFKSPGIPVATHITKYAQYTKVTMTIIGVDYMKSYMRGSYRLGSVTDKVTIKSRCTVCLIRDRPRTSD